MNKAQALNEMLDLVNLIRDMINEEKPQEIGPWVGGYMLRDDTCVIEISDLEHKTVVNIEPDALLEFKKNEDFLCGNLRFILNGWTTRVSELIII